MIHDLPIPLDARFLPARCVPDDPKATAPGFLLSDISLEEVLAEWALRKAESAPLSKEEPSASLSKGLWSARLDAPPLKQGRLFGVLYLAHTAGVPFCVREVSVLGSPELSWKMPMTGHKDEPDGETWTFQACRSVMVLPPNFVRIRLDRVVESDPLVFAVVTPAR